MSSEEVKSYFSGERIIIPFSKVLGTLKDEDPLTVKIYVGDGSNAGAFMITGESVDAFINEYKAWLDAQ